MFQKPIFFFSKIKETVKKINNPFSFIRNQLTARNSRGQMIFQELEAYIFANSQIKQIDYEQILLKYNLLIVHVWLLQQGLKRNHFANYLLIKQLDSTLYKSAANYIFQFDDNFNQEMKQELERNQFVIKYVLDDFFIYSLKQKSLQQIISEDILLSQEKDTTKITNLCFYVEKNLKLIQELNDQDKLRTGKIEWIQ